ncbi:hypothetical protein MYA_4143 [Burkholderia sp. KJ006]|nr:hypothetical protein MYA_4143 [Burkholderia sp. KJ006]
MTPIRSKLPHAAHRVRCGWESNRYRSNIDALSIDSGRE